MFNLWYLEIWEKIQNRRSIYQKPCYWREEAWRILINAQGEDVVAGIRTPESIES